MHYLHALGYWRIKLPSLTVADLSFIIFNPNLVKFKKPYTALSAKSYSCRAQISNSPFFSVAMPPLA